MELELQAFTTYKKLCKYYDIPSNTFNHIRRTNITISLNSLVERATGIKLPDNLKIVKGILCEDVLYTNYAELCKSKSIDYITFKKYQKKHSDLTDDRLIKLVLSKKIVKYNSVEYKGYKDLCESHGVNYKTFMRRKQIYPNMDIDYWLFKKKY